MFQALPTPPPPNAKQRYPNTQSEHTLTHSLVWTDPDLQIQYISVERNADVIFFATDILLSNFLTGINGGFKDICQNIYLAMVHSLSIDVFFSRNALLNITHSCYP